MEGMKPNLPDPETLDGDVEVMGAFDAIGGTPAFVIADITREDVWLAVPAAETLDLEDWQ